MSRRPAHDLGPIGPVLRGALRDDRAAPPPDFTDPILARLDSRRRASPRSASPRAVVSLLTAAVLGVAAWSTISNRPLHAPRDLAESTAAPSDAPRTLASVTSSAPAPAANPLARRNDEALFAPGTVAGQVESVLRDDADVLALR